jgi:hypothetical protein
MDMSFGVDEVTAITTPYCRNQYQTIQDLS